MVGEEVAEEVLLLGHTLTEMREVPGELLVRAHLRARTPLNRRGET